MSEKPRAVMDNEQDFDHPVLHLNIDNYSTCQFVVLLHVFAPIARITSFLLYHSLKIAIY